MRRGLMICGLLGWLIAVPAAFAFTMSTAAERTLEAMINAAGQITTITLYGTSVLFQKWTTGSTGNLVLTNTEAAPGTLTATLAGAGAGNVNNGTHSYKATFVTPNGETDAGAVSGTVTTTSGNGQVSLSSIPLGSTIVTARKIYRTAAGNNSVGPWKLLATISDNTTTTYADNIADASLTTAIPVVNTAIDTRLTITNAGQMQVVDLKTTGAATGKNVVCVDTATGQLYASSTGTDCSN